MSKRRKRQVCPSPDVPLSVNDSAELQKFNTYLLVSAAIRETGDPSGVLGAVRETIYGASLYGDA